MIHFQDIHVYFNRGSALEMCVLNNINLSINKGEFITIIGSNGAGKSTLLNVLCGDLFPNQGKILIDDKDVTLKTSWQRAGDVARVFQDPLMGTCANLTIEENLAIAYHRGKKRSLKFAINAQMRDVFRSSLSRLKLGLEDRLQDPIGLLSGGQRQAISLIMATLQPTKILVLDEHTAALDPRTAEFILHLTQEIIQEKQLTALMVTHSMHQALQMGGRTLMLHEGKIILDVEGSKRKKLTINDLLGFFHHASGADLDDDSLLLS